MGQASTNHTGHAPDDRSDDRAGVTGHGADAGGMPPVHDGGFVLYREVQGFWRNQLVLVLLPMESVITGGILLAVGYGLPPKDQIILLSLWVCFGLVLPLLLLTWRLKIEVTPTHLRAGFAGLRKWRIPLDEVELAESVRVEPIRDLGGWGIRFNRRFGKILNVAGDRAVVVTLVDGEKRTLGTQQPEELVGAVLAGAIGEPGRLIVPVEHDAHAQPADRGGT